MLTPVIQSALPTPTAVPSAAIISNCQRVRLELALKALDCSWPSLMLASTILVLAAPKVSTCLAATIIAWAASSLRFCKPNSTTLSKAAFTPTAFADSALIWSLWPGRPSAPSFRKTWSFA
jgi:hypothetical protein